ncbi:MAG: SDR family oxidoreductase [Gammaproteobacteria bacterium]|nr:SDR family oxidoreductase [Gammaproteobacteria bacterium]
MSKPTIDPAIFDSSEFANNPYPTLKTLRDHYPASKGAGMSWTCTIAQEVGRYNIAVNAVAPVIETPLVKKYFARMSPEEFETLKAGMKQRIPLGGWFGDPDREFAPAMVVLASDAAHFLTGQTYAVDGGHLLMKRDRMGIDRIS